MTTTYESDIATWSPLEVLGAFPEDFMWMGASAANVDGVDVLIHHYKHCDTRNYLFLSLSGGLVVAWMHERASWRPMHTQRAYNHAISIMHKSGDGCLGNRE